MLAPGLRLSNVAQKETYIIKKSFSSDLIGIPDPALEPLRV